MRGQGGYIVMDLPPFSNVVASGLATNQLNNLLGYTIDSIILELGGGALTKAMLTNVKLIANEKPIFEDTGARIDSRMQYRGIAANAAYLDLDFSEKRARTIVGQKTGCIDTVSSGILKLSMEVTIAGATTPTLSGYAVVSAAPQHADYGRLIAKVINSTQSPAAAGEFPFPMQFGARRGAFVKRVHFFGSTVTAVRVKKNGIEIFKATDARNDFLQGEFVRTPQANIFTIDFVVDGNMTEALALENVQAMDWLVTVSGAGNVIVVTEMLDLLENH